MELSNGPNQSRIFGLLRSRSGDKPPAGYNVLVRIGTKGRDTHRIASGFSHLDGGFVIPLSEAAKASLIHSELVVLEIQDTFGRSVESYGPISGVEALRELAIDIVPRPLDERPPAAPFQDPFGVHAQAYAREIEALSHAGVHNWAEFARADIEALSHRRRFSRLPFGGFSSARRNELRFRGVLR